MKHTIKIEARTSVTVQAGPDGLLLGLEKFGLTVGSYGISRETAMQIIEAAEAALKQSEGVRCHDASACQAGQRACPSPAACGVL